jgi:acyl-coenzyme A thioesterase PaaI-like protein
VTTEENQAKMDKIARQEHAECFLCGKNLPHGLRLQFCVQPDQAIQADYLPEATRQGYRGILHGGVIASLLDSAMTHALFAHGIVAVTVRLSVRYRHPIRIGVPVMVRGWVVDAKLPVCNVAAEIRQEGRHLAQASGLFMASPNTTQPHESEG